jgi:nickel superoxide dismutase
MKKTFITFLGILFITPIFKALGHCEIPCGIYDDSVRIELIREHIRTVEKAMNKIMELQKKDEINYNQLVRWINNKEEHAVKIQDIVSHYFLHQRIKYTKENENGRNLYIDQLTVLHQLLVYAMKSKQTTALDNIQKMRALVDEFEKLYFHEH